MKTMTTFKTLCIFAGLAMATCAFAGDGTKDNPYTVAELNAQKEALAASGATVWVKADLKGLGEDGSRTDNGDYLDANDKIQHRMAGLFGDETETFVAYSYHILSQIRMSDWTNTKDLLIALTYGTEGHPYGNLQNPKYAESIEPTEAHFSIEEVHGALTLEIKNGFRGYHIGSCYIVPEGVVATTVLANYSSSKGATVTYRYYGDPAEEKERLIPKHSAMVLIAADGIYDFVLGTGLYEQPITNSNSLNGGAGPGENTNTTKDRWHYRFVATADKVGFERNSDDPQKVVLESGDEVILSINSKEEHFAGHWTWETEDKKWISWKGHTAADFGFISNIKAIDTEVATDGAIYDLTGRRVAQPTKGLYIQNGKKYIAK